MAIRPEKAAKVAEIKELLTSSKCTVLVDFCGLTVAQDTALRRKMREAGVTYIVVKNTLLRIAAQEAGIEGWSRFLKRTPLLRLLRKTLLPQQKSFAILLKKTKHLLLKQVFLTVKLLTMQLSKLWQNCRRKKYSLPKCLAA